MKISEALDVSSAKLWQAGVYDSYLGIDSRLHIDPALLRATRIPEFRGSWKRFGKYFDQVFLLLTSAKQGGKLEGQCIDRLIFPEINLAALGYSDGESKGRGVSRGLATQLYNTAKEIAEAGIKEPAIFELAVIFEEDFGPDKISDMTLWVIREDVGAFNKRVCTSLGIKCQTVKIGGLQIPAAYSDKQKKSLLLLPASLLADLPEATCYDDIGAVAAYNQEIRNSLSAALGSNWRKLVKGYKKKELKQLLVSEPELLRHLIEAYKANQAKPYDFIADPLGEVVWEKIGKDEASTHGLKLTKAQSADEVRLTISAIVEQFKHLVEQCGSYKHLYVGNKHRPEKFAQLLFYAVADSYCRANDLDLSAEPNAGRGPVDFKVSKGYQARGLVELKLSSNSKGIDGLLAQLPTYVGAEKANYSCFVMIVVGAARVKVDHMASERNKLLQAGKAVPDLVVIDAYAAATAPSASKLRWR